MEELFNLTYKDEVEELKELGAAVYESLGDEKYIFHEDMEARLYWAFCRPSGSHPKQIADPHPLVSIMAFNHSRLKALDRFRLIHPEVIKEDKLRVKISKRTRMLFRDLVDNDFKELNEVLELVPVFLDVAVDQLINGRKWNDIFADEIEATKFLQKAKEHNSIPAGDDFYEALYLKLADFEEFGLSELKEYLARIEEQKNCIDNIILEYYKKKTKEYLDDSDLHILQKKSIETIIKRF
jgi:hypothetical protein